MKKKICLLLSIIILFSTCAINTVLASSYLSLDFTVTDSVIHPTKPIIFMSDKQNKTLYAVNYQTGKKTSLTFDLPPERMVIANDKLYVCLLNGEHSSYWWEEDQTGAIGIIDLGDFSVKEIIDIALDPYDIAVDDNYFYVSSGSGQWTYLNSYNIETHELISTTSIRQRSPIEFHADKDKIYTVTTDTSPRDISCYVISDGKFVKDYDSPYHGDYSMGIINTISPDGKYIFNNSGNIFTCDNDSTKNMYFSFSLSSYNAICFDEQNNKFYTSVSDGQIYSYNYNTFAGLGVIENIGKAMFMYCRDNKIIAVSLYGGKYIVEQLEVDNNDIISPTPSTIELSNNNNIISGITYSSMTDMIVNKDAGCFYSVEADTNTLYKVDLKTMQQMSISLEYIPSSVDYYGDEIFVGMNTSGIVCVYDAQTLTLKERISSQGKFSDLALGNDGYLYILSSDGIKSISPVTKQIVSTYYNSYNGILSKNYADNSFYYSTRNVSPADIQKFLYSEGMITKKYDSPYHGDYSIGALNKISPDGKYVFNSSGNVFSSNTTQQQDLLYLGKLPTSFVDAEFIADKNQIMTLTANNSSVTVYDCSNFTKKGSFKVQGNPQNIFTINDTVYTIAKGDKGYQINYILIDDIIPYTADSLLLNCEEVMTLSKNDEYKLKVTALYKNGDKVDVTSTCSYTLDNDHVTITSNGYIKAQSYGKTKLTVKFDDKVKTVEINVLLAASRLDIPPNCYISDFDIDTKTYVITVSKDTTQVPEINGVVDKNYLSVEMNKAETLNDVTTMIVTDNQENVSESYSIKFEVSEYLESSHPYENESTLEYTYIADEPKDYIVVQFAGETSLEDGYDFIELYDGDGNPVGKGRYTGSELSNKFIAAKGDRLIVKLITDTYGNDFGFRVLSAESYDFEDDMNFKVSPFLDAENNPLTSIEGQSAISINFENINISSDNSTSCVGYVASYTDDGTLISISSVDIDCDKSEYKSATISENVLSTTKTMKVFLWDKESQTPMVKMSSISR